MAKRRKSSAQKIEKLENEIESRLKAYRKPEEGFPRYADLRSRLEKLNPKQFFQGKTAVWHTLCAAVERNQQPSDVFSLSTSVTPYAHLSNQIRKCGYVDSPWRHYRLDRPYDRNLVAEHLETLFGYFQERTKTAERTLIGDASLGWLLTSHYFRSHPFGSLSDAQQKARHQLELAIQAVEYLANHMEYSESSNWPSKLWLDILDKSYFESLYERLPLAGDVTEIKRILQGDEVKKILESDFIQFVENWPEIIASCIYKNWLTTLETNHPAGFNTALDTQTDLADLNVFLQEKRNDDRHFVRLKFVARLGSKNWLMNNNLLNLTKAAGIRKTELRDLYFRGFTQFTNLYPVLLATPETACCILPMEQGLFDLAIIDEASQMFMAEAFPLLFRGKAVVVSGDSKQMPPADFFAATVHDDDDEIDDEESDANNAELISQQQLNIPAWGETCLLEAAEKAVTQETGHRVLEIHYRSAAPELIEFSNQAFYQGKLQCPPTNSSRQAILSAPIVYQYVEQGTFANGINQIECDYIIQQLRAIWASDNPPTTGVIVLNVKQANLIEDKLRNDPDLLEKLEREINRKEEGEDVGFFVRSVEHVQGDERDLIIFGTTYSGQNRNFGPISKQDKGRRRLNVAITRAKKAMIVVSSLDIDAMAAPFATISDGKFLQYYLRYARVISNGNGAEAVNAIFDELNPNRLAFRTAQSYDSDFERDVAEFLRQESYLVDSQIGESGFRIDLAVKNENGIGYLCGIECDGAQYHSGWKVRANDIWRQKVLEDKGWKILRIWSTDWFNDTLREKDRVLRQLEQLQI